MRGGDGIAGGGKVIGVPKFHSWGKCTMTLTKLRLDVQRFLACVLIIYTASWGVINRTDHRLVEVSTVGPIANG